MTWFDLLIIMILVLSIGFAALRGAVRELATLLALAIAAGLAFLLFNPVLGALGMKGSIFGMIGVPAVLLAVFFVGLYIAFHLGLKRMTLSGGAARADRIGGGVYGLLRGLALIGLGFLGYAYSADEAKRPDAVNKALLLPVAQGSANFFESLAPVYDSQDIITPDEIKEKVNAANDGYARGDRAALNEIVTTATTSEPDAAPADTDTPDDDPIADILSEDQRSGQ